MSTAKVAIVTGASRGIGVALTRALIDAGYQVHAVARTPEPINQTYRSEIDSGQVIPAVLDISDRVAVDRFFDTTFSAGSRLDLLFNNAGRFNSLAPLWDADPDNWWGDVTVNLRGTFLMTRGALKRMIAVDAGIIVSMDGGRPPVGSGYAASKAGIAQMTLTLSQELRHVGSSVSVFCADPGLVATDMAQAHAVHEVAPQWMPGLDARLASGEDVRRPEEIAHKLVAQLPHMTPATSGGKFYPDTPTGTFMPAMG